VKLTFGLALGLVAGAAIAQGLPEPAPIEPGLWEVTATVDSGDMPGAQMDVGKVMKQAPTVARHCLTPEDAARGPLALLQMTRPDCSFTRSTMADGKLDAAMSCAAGTPQAMTVAVRGRFSPRAYEAVSNIVMSGGMTMTVAVTAKWIGACSS
jgi:hypothetical protein